MRLKIPMTGTVIDYSAELGKIDGIGIRGDDQDPVRPINLDLGNVAWRLISIDLGQDLMEIEVSPPKKIGEVVLDSITGQPKLDKDGKPVVILRAPTLGEQAALLANAQHIVESNTAAQLYAMSGSKKLVKPATVMAKYQAAKQAPWLD